MIHRYRHLAIFLMATCAHLPGAAAPNALGTWRCAHNSYSDQPCTGGKAIDVADPRSNADRRASDAVTRRDRAAADALERERLQRETLARRDGRPIVFGKAPVEPAPSSGRHEAKPNKKTKKGEKSAKEPSYFTAYDPQAGGAPATKRKK